MSKEALDKVFSEFVRLRDSNDEGIGLCISCGKPVHWKKANNGHFVNRGHMSLRFSETNCNLQCINCNLWDEGNNEGYRRGLIKKYGPEIIDKLYLAKSQVNKFSKFELEAMVKHYKAEVKKLKEEKGL